MAGELGQSSKHQQHPQQLIFENVSPATRLLEKRRQMYEVQDALEQQKANFGKKEEQFRKKEEQLRSKDLQLQHQLFRFNKFLLDNEGKRRRAETRAAEEVAQIREKEKEIADLMKQLEEGEQKRKDLDDDVQKNMKYENFLELVKDRNEDYQHIEELVTRYETLETANKDLMALQESCENEIEEVRARCHAYKKEKEMEMLAMTNREATLSSELDDAQKTKNQLEKQVEEVTKQDSEHNLHFGQILMSVDNLFLRCTTKRKNIHHSSMPMDEDDKKDDDGHDDGDDNKKKHKLAVTQLRTIMDYIKDYKDIVEELKRHRRTDAARRGPPQQALAEPAKPPEPQFIVEQTDSRADRGSHTSGSQGNTREISRVTGAGAGDSARVTE